jgi:uncharacterized damage-inducible protein DinB
MTLSIKHHNQSISIAMTNKDFFKACLINELAATAQAIKALPNDQLDYRPHPNSRSAYEIAEHIIAHAFDFNVILNESTCDECLIMPFNSTEEGAQLLMTHWEKAISTIDTLDENSFNTVDVALLVSGKPLLTIPRSNMLWFFLFDIIHHRGQLSTYIRPMGGKNPAIYGYSFDSLQQ